MSRRGKTEQNACHARSRSACAAHCNRKTEKSAYGRPPNKYFEDFSIDHGEKIPGGYSTASDT
jgi:hypothetical protein